MSAEDFGNCYVNTVGGEVDDVVKLVNQVGAGTIKQLTDWWKSMPAWYQATFTLVAGYSLDKLKKALAAIIGVEAAEAIILLLGAVSWGILIASFVNCADHL
jgi:hypothetical protein